MGTFNTAETVWPSTMLIAIAIWINTIVRGSKRPHLITSSLIPTGSSGAPPALACHVRVVRRQSSDAFYESIEEGGDIGRDGDIEVRGLTRQSPTVRDGHPARQLAARLDVDVPRLGGDEAPVECRRDGQGIVDERAVEAVIAEMELHVVAQRIGHIPDDRVARHGASRLHRVLAPGERDR